MSQDTALSLTGLSSCLLNRGGWKHLLLPQHVSQGRPAPRHSAFAWLWCSLQHWFVFSKDKNILELLRRELLEDTKPTVSSLVLLARHQRLLLGTTVYHTTSHHLPRPLKSKVCTRSKSKTDLLRFFS